MFDENQIAQVRWCSRNKEYFTSMGFHFTKMGDIVNVPAKLLMPKSSALVKCVCDYCGEEFITQYSNYTKNKARGKIACKHCKLFKIEDSFMIRYGVKSVGASKECRDKAEQVMLDKYGHRFALQTEKGRQSFEEAMYDKYGYTNPILCPELAAKARLAMYKNGTIPTSQPEIKIVEMLYVLYGKENCIPGYPIGRVNLDCLLTINNVKIDVEYDGWYWHRDKQDYDRRRNYWLLQQGYRILRISGNEKEDLPTIKQIKEKIDYLLDGHHLTYIDMNN